MSTYPNDDEYSMNGINHLSKCKDFRARNKNDLFIY